MKNRSLVFKLVSVLISLALAGIDRFTKVFAVGNVKPVGTINLVKFGETEWLNFTYCENTGMSFSLLEGQTFILIAVPILLIGLVEWYIFSGHVKRTDTMIALAALAGGGLGNLIDRVMQGYVVDFIDVRIINFAIFNFADICAVCGGIYFGIVLLIEEYKEDKQKKQAQPEPESGAGTAEDGSGDDADSDDTAVPEDESD